MSSEGLSEVDRKFFEADILLPSYDDQYDMKAFLEMDEILGQPMSMDFDLPAESDTVTSGQDAFINTIINKSETNCLPMDLSSQHLDSPTLTQTCSYAPPASSPHSPTPLSPASSSSSSSSSPVEQTLIFIPQEEGGDRATQLLLPSDLSQYPGSVLSPSSTAGLNVPSSSSSSSTLSPISVSSGVPVQLNSILNQKVQILPKPNTGIGKAKIPASRTKVVSVGVSGTGATGVTVGQVAPKMGQKPVTVKPAAAKKLVLTAEEFAKLTASGALRFNPPTSDPLPISTVTSVPVSTTPTINSAVSSLSDMLSPFECGDNTKSKRQQRMIKNRESASLSRKRKKEYLTSLEDKIKEYNAENQKLKNENLALKSRVQQLHDENLQLKQSAGLTSHKKAFLLVTALFLTLNLGSFSSLVSLYQPLSNSQASWLEQPPVRGRHLLSLADSSASSAYDGDSDLGSSAGAERLWGSEHARKIMQFDEDLQHLLTRGMLNESVVAAHFCPIYFNSTESLRLAEQLRGWMIREEEVKQKKQTPKPRPPPKKKAYHPVNTLKAAMQGHYAKDLEGSAHRNSHGQPQQQYPVQVFQHNDPRQKLLNAIPRRNDTFYVLSFNTDYFLVPATDHNKTARPRMSLVMPVVSETLNDTMQPPEGSVGMMQIDCEILHTQLIHIRKSVFPEQPQQPSDAFNPRFDNHTANASHHYHDDDPSDSHSHPHHGNQTASTNHSRKGMEMPSKSGRLSSQLRKQRLKTGK